MRSYAALTIALLNTVLNDRIDLHLARLHDAVAWDRGPAIETLAALTQRFTALGFGTDARTMALKQLTLMARQQGTVMAFGDVFLLLAVLFLAFAALILAMRKPPEQAQAISEH